MVGPACCHGRGRGVAGVRLRQRVVRAAEVAVHVVQEIAKARFSTFLRKSLVTRVKRRIPIRMVSLCRGPTTPATRRKDCPVKSTRYPYHRARRLGLWARHTGGMRSPQLVPASGLPSRVQIYEVGPRDGLQNEASTVSVDVKLEFIDRLADAGLDVIEATSFVRPEWVPQLADAEELTDRLVRRDGVRYPVLVPNERGLDRALAKGMTDIAIFGSATETFAQRNLNRSVDESIAMFAPVRNAASSLARYATRPATSSGLPRRPIGICGMILLSRTSFGIAITIFVPM